MSVKGARGVLCNGDGGSGTTVITVNHEELLLNNCYTHSSRPISQIPQCIKYPTMHHFITKMCTRVHISVTCAYFCFKMVYCGIWDWCIVGFVTGLFINCFLIHNLPRYAYQNQKEENQNVHVMYGMFSNLWYIFYLDDLVQWDLVFVR